MSTGTRLFALTALTMVAFAANSILNRMALADLGMGPASFAAIRLMSGAALLTALVWRTHRRVAPFAPGRATGVIALSAYVIGFSYAYVTLDAGLGALLLFGGVQITMFAGGLLGGERPPARRWAGAVLALTGLAWLLWPAGVSPPPLSGVALMLVAALGWGIYSLQGRGASDPTEATASNFLLAAPLGIALVALLPDAAPPTGIALAILSGAVTSGLGYALWYTVLPQLTASSAAVAQLSVPVIALAAGAALLGEPITTRLLLASALVLGGILLSATAKR
ncbi:MAG: DMT family transporter [Pseudomonadota bacterium]